jgi:hypothetical protein
VKKVLTSGRIQTGVFADDLDCHVAVQHFIQRAIDGSHSSFANLRYDAAMTEHLTDHRVLLSHSC